MSFKLKILLRMLAAIEVGAITAYRGHYRRTKDRRILKIIFEEQEHLEALNDWILEKSIGHSGLMMVTFYCVGVAVSASCRFLPKKILNIGAMAIEIVGARLYAMAAQELLVLGLRDRNLALGRFYRQELNHAKTLKFL